MSWRPRHRLRPALILITLTLHCCHQFSGVRRVGMNASWVLRIRPWSLYALLLALLSVGASTVLRMIFAQFGATLFFATYFPAVLVVAVFAGVPGAVLVTALTTVIAWWAYFPPAVEFGVFTGTQIANLATFWLSAALIIWLAQVYRQNGYNIAGDPKSARTSDWRTQPPGGKYVGRFASDHIRYGDQRREKKFDR